MTPGALDTIWANQDNPAEPRRYRMVFMAYGAGFQHGAQPHLEIVGQDDLLAYFVGLQVSSMTIERRAERARQWLLEIHSAGHLSLPNVQLDDEHLAAFRHAS